MIEHSKAPFPLRISSSPTIPMRSQRERTTVVRNNHFKFALVLKVVFVAYNLTNLLNESIYNLEYILFSCFLINRTVVANVHFFKRNSSSRFQMQLTLNFAARRGKSNALETIFDKSCCFFFEIWEPVVSQNVIAHFFDAYMAISL